MPSASSCGMARTPSRVAGTLMKEVRPVDQPPQRPSLGHRPLGLEGEPRIDLDGDAPVAASGRVEDRAQDVAGGAHVPGGEGAGGLLDRDAPQGEVANLEVVGARSCKGLL